MRRRHRERIGCAAIAALIALLWASGAAASEGGLVLLPDLYSKFPLLIAFFVLLIFPANALLLRPILRVLDEREKRTAGTRSRAKKIMEDAGEVLANYERAVRDVREEAETSRKQYLAEARGEHASLTAAARSDAKGEITRARSEIAAAVDESRVSMRAQVETLADEATARGLGRSL